MTEPTTPTTPGATRPLIVDAHEDIAWNALNYGRNYTQSAASTRRAEVHSDVPEHNGRALLGLPDWLAGNVAVIFGTLYVSPERHRTHASDLQFYRNADEAHHRAGMQLDHYRRFAEDHEQVELIATGADLERVVASWDGAKGPPRDPEVDSRRVGIVPLMEGADPIRVPAEVEEWYARGVRIVGLAWSGTRYAGGTREPGPLTPLGHALIDAMAALGMILDTSHLAEQAFFEVLDRYPGPLIASHSNPRVLASERLPDRHLSNDMIARLAERGGVQGITPLNGWLRRDTPSGNNKQTTSLAHVVAAIDHVCQIAGNAQHVGLGSDFDGGFGLDSVPAEVDSISDLIKIAPLLAERGYTPEDVVAVMGGNWLRVLRGALR